jgi:hypothetical protein
MGWYKNTLGQAAQDAIREATKTYVAEMARLFPVGSTWICFHGSKKGYAVQITSHSEYGIGVLNPATGKRRRVWWATLQDPKEAV